MEHFINVTKPSAPEPVILILDWHYSLTRNIEFIDLGKFIFLRMQVIRCRINVTTERFLYPRSRKRVA